MNKDSVYASGFVDIKQQDLLDERKARRMIRSEIEGAMQVLIECGYDPSILAGSPINIDALLNDELIRTVDFFSEYCTDQALLQSELKRYDYHNLKAALKARSLSAQGDQIPSSDAFYSVGNLDKAAIIEAVSLREYEGLPRQMAEALTFLEERGRALSGRLIETTIDRAMHEDIQSVAKGIRSSAIRHYFLANSDVANILTAFRYRRLDLNGLSEELVAGGSLPFESLITIQNSTPETIRSEFLSSEYSDYIDILLAAHENKCELWEAEKQLTDYLFSLSRTGLMNTFSSEPIFAWYIQKLEEIKTIKLIIAAKTNKMSEQTLLKRLRSIYV